MDVNRRTIYFELVATEGAGALGAPDFIDRMAYLKEMGEWLDDVQRSEP